LKYGEVVTGVEEWRKMWKCGDECGGVWRSVVNYEKVWWGREG